MTFFQILLLFFLFIPVVEIYLLIEVGSMLGAFTTVVLVVFTAVLGAWLLRIQGFSTLQRVRRSLAQGEIPAIEMLGGVLLIITGALLLTPGFFTDSIGFLLLVPAFRHRVVVWLLGHAHIIRGPGRGRRGSGYHPRGPAEQKSRGPRTLEGEYRKEDDD